MPSYILNVGTKRVMIREHGHPDRTEVVGETWEDKATFIAGFTGLDLLYPLPGDDMPSALPKTLEDWYVEQKKRP
jgi:hypothetical protein